LVAPDISGDGLIRFELDHLQVTVKTNTLGEEASEDGRRGGGAEEATDGPLGSHDINLLAAIQKVLGCRGRLEAILLVDDQNGAAGHFGPWKDLPGVVAILVDTWDSGLEGTCAGGQNDHIGGLALHQGGVGRHAEANVYAELATLEGGKAAGTIELFAGRAV